MNPASELERPIWLIGEFPSVMDQRHHQPFSDSAGNILWNMLEEVGIPRSQCFSRYLTWERPNLGDPKHWFCTKTQAPKMGFIQHGDKYVTPVLYENITKLKEDIAAYKPRLVLCFGNLALYAITGNLSAKDWRGSQLKIIHEDGTYTKLIPTLAPSLIQKMWHWRYFAVQDLRRAEGEIITSTYREEPTENFTIRPTLEEVLSHINRWMERLDSSEVIIPFGVDIETRLRHITYLAIAESSTSALCIPFASCIDTAGYWSAKDELTIIQALRPLLEHPMFGALGQNFTYDTQYIIRDWGINCIPLMDTMIAWHTAFPGLEKSLAFICSMLLPFYAYWKDEGNHGQLYSIEDEDKYMYYNCKDAARTLELYPILLSTLEKIRLIPQYEEQMSLFEPVLIMMLRGFKQNVALKNEFRLRLMDITAQYDAEFETWTEALTGGIPLVKSKKASPWWRSSDQQRKIFYDLYKVGVVRHPKTGKPTVDDEALTIIGKRELLLKPICDKLKEYRSVQVFLGNFVNAALDWDDRMRCSFGIGMAETFRFTSSEDVFGYGTNIQNLPKGNTLDND